VHSFLVGKAEERHLNLEQNKHLPIKSSSVNMALLWPCSRKRKMFLCGRYQSAGLQNMGASVSSQKEIWMKKSWIEKFYCVSTCFVPGLLFG
jgi:hypothetical protein